MAQHIATIQEIRDRTLAEGFTINDVDIISFDHGTGSKRHRAFTVGELIAYLKANKLDGMTIGTTAEIKTSSGNPVIVNFYAIDAGTIEAKTKFKVGGRTSALSYGITFATQESSSAEQHKVYICDIWTRAIYYGQRL